MGAEAYFIIASRYEEVRKRCSKAPYVFLLLILLTSVMLIMFYNIIIEGPQNEVKFMLPFLWLSFGLVGLGFLLSLIYMVMNIKNKDNSLFAIVYFCSVFDFCYIMQVAVICALLDKCYDEKAWFIVGVVIWLSGTIIGIRQWWSCIRKLRMGKYSKSEKKQVEHGNLCGD